MGYEVLTAGSRNSVFLLWRLDTVSSFRKRKEEMGSKIVPLRHAVATGAFLYGSLKPFPSGGKAANNAKEFADISR